MKARDIKIGDVTDGWTVTDIKPAAEWPGVIRMNIVLLTLEREASQRTGRSVDDLDPVKIETRRDWYRADAEVEVSRGE